MIVWDALRAAGRDAGLEPFGYRALDALRMEKGYRYYGVDMTMLETPDEAGLGAFVRRGPGRLHRPGGARGAPVRRAGRPRAAGCGRSWPANRRAASCPSTAARPSASRGDVVGRLRSVAFGPTVGRTIGYVYLPPEIGEGTASRSTSSTGGSRPTVARARRSSTPWPGAPMPTDARHRRHPPGGQPAASAWPPADRSPADRVHPPGGSTSG